MAAHARSFSMTSIFFLFYDSNDKVEVEWDQKSRPQSNEFLLKNGHHEVGGVGEGVGVLLEAVGVRPSHAQVDVSKMRAVHY